ncbi:MAG: hypothetical protein GY807_20890 [Gammaproteobacteria bacterium]|nr:hypothetical protein [Gammaproteobacteria bacterium]
MSNSPTLSNVERQARRYRRKVQIGELKRIEVTLPLEDTLKLGFLAKHWRCTRTKAFRRVLIDAWEREDQPV